MKFSYKKAKVNCAFTLALLSCFPVIAHAEQTAIEVVAENPKATLMAKLENINFFSAQFSQKVFDHEGKVLQEGAGEIAVVKPNLIHWKTETPDESLIVSDGEHLWFYDPFIEQASVYILKDAIANTPILLLTTHDESQWQNYSVSEINSATYLIHSNDKNSPVQSLELNFGEIENSFSLEKLSFLDNNGQLSVITLENANYKAKPDSKLFTFDSPEGTHIDDQR